MRRLAVLVCAFLACTRADSPAPFRLRVAAVGPLEELSPELQDGYGMLVQGLVFEPLVQPERGGPRRSTVVRDWQRVNASTYRFRLAPEVSFSDGSALRSQDFETALAGHATVEAANGWLTLRWNGPGERPEEQLLTVSLARQSHGGPIGTGPFSVAAQDPTHLLLRRRQAISRRVHEVELVSFPTPREAFAATLRGDVNALLMPDDGQLELLSGIDRLRVIHGPGPHSVVAVFNTARLGSRDRKELGLALPREALASAYGPQCRSEGGAASTGPMPEGPPLNVLVANAPPGLVRTALALRSALGSRGGSISVVTLEEARKRAFSGDFDLLILTVQTWPLEFSISHWLTGSSRNLNFTRYSNPRVDAALQASDYPLAQAELAEDPPAAVLCRLERTAAVDARLTDAQLGDYDMLDSLASWQVAP